jgi:hypothetical protein
MAGASSVANPTAADNGLHTELDEFDAEQFFSSLSEVSAYSNNFYTLTGKKQGHTLKTLLFDCSFFNPFQNFLCKFQ